MVGGGGLEQMRVGDVVGRRRRRLEEQRVGEGIFRRRSWLEEERIVGVEGGRSVSWRKRRLEKLWDGEKEDWRS